MGVTGFTAANYLEDQTGLGIGGAADEVLLFGWQFEPVGQSAGISCELFDTVQPSFRGVFSSAGGNPGAAFFETVGVTATCTADEPNNAWYNVGGWFFADSNVEAWLNGGNKGANSGAPGTITTPNRFRIGLNGSGGGSVSTIGFAEYSVWDTAGFSVAQRDTLVGLLALGHDPLTLTAQTGQPWSGRLVAYYELDDTADTNDLSGNGFHLTTVGTLSNFGSHPVILAAPAASVALSASPVAHNRIDLTWTNPTNTTSVEVYRGVPEMSDDFTGTDTDPLDANKWDDESIGTATAEIEGNRAALTVADVGVDEVRLLTLDGSGLPFTVDDFRVNYEVEAPLKVGAEQNGTYYGLILGLRGDGLWADVNAGSPHDVNNGYMVTVRRNDPSGGPLNRLSLDLFRVVDGAATLLSTFRRDDYTAITNVRCRVECIGDHIRAIMRDASEGALPDGEWDLDVVDGTFSSGRVSVSVRGEGGGSQADRTGYLDNFAIQSWNLLTTLGDVESHQDGPGTGLAPSTAYDYRVLAYDSTPGVIGQGSDSATTLAASTGNAAGIAGYFNPHVLGATGIVV